MIRELSADELAWFMRQALTFAGHADPAGLALKLQSKLRHPAQDASSSFALFEGGEGLAGVNVQSTHKGDGVMGVTLSTAWHAGDGGALLTLVEALLDRYPHEVARLPLHLLPEERCAELAAMLKPLGFAREQQTRLRFELSEVPPLGAPLVLEAYRQEDERAFRELYEAAEGREVSEAQWAYLKRKGGPFSPNLWFVARQTLDQEPVGYAFCGTQRRGIDATYTLVGAGVLQRFRSDSEMLRRLLLSLLHELSGASPFGAVDTLLPDTDPKLIEILQLLGFDVVERTPLLIKRPV